MASLGAVSSGDFIRPYMTGPNSPRLRHFPEDASQSFLKGDVLIQGGAGLENKVKIAGDNPTSAIVGIAAEDATGVTGHKVGVWMAEPHAEFVGRGEDDDGVDFSDIGTARALLIDATNDIWRVETSDAGNDAVVVLRFLHPVTRQVIETEGSTLYDALVVFRFVEAATVYGTVT